MSLLIPNAEKKVFQTYKTDMGGSIHYSKSINLDEQGYIKLSSRSILLKTENGDTDFDIPTAFGRYAGTEFYIPTIDEEFVASISPTSVSVSADNGTSVPSPGVSSSGRWYKNLFHVTASTKMWYKTPATGNWTDTGVTLTSGVRHQIEVFRNRNTICVSNGNVVKQYTSVYGASTDLTLPADYEVVGMSYSNNRMGIITKLSSTAVGQNQDAFFFVWNGSTTDAQGGQPVGIDQIYAIAPYKSSWLILTVTGQFKYFNGGGWDEVGALPIYFKNIAWEDTNSNSLGFGDLMTVEGDVVYVNLNSKLSPFGSKDETFLYNNPGGILCFDLETGVYHRYAPSNSQAYFITATAANVDLTTNIITKSTGTIPDTGNPIKSTSSDVTGIVTNKIYYVIKVSSTEFKVASTRALALAGTAIDLTAKGGGISYFLSINEMDYGASRVIRGGAVGTMITPTNVADHLLYGGEMMGTDGSIYAFLCATVSGFENRGYFVTSKDVSNQITDNHQRVYVKYRPLKTDDKILVKYRDKDVLGLPCTPPTAVTWTSSTVFTTTFDLSEAMAYVTAGNELECEVINGAGAGQMVKVTSITEASGTYTVTLTEAVIGAANTLKSMVLIENWKVLGEITSADTNGFKSFPLRTSSPWIQYKVELRGSDTTIEEFRTADTEQLKVIA